jgi:hypothetical protein
MLNPKELASLLSVLGEEDKSLETLSTQFHKTFNKLDQFKVGCSIYLLLQDGLVPKLSHRLAGYYLLFEMYRTEPLASNPFLPTFLDSLQKDLEINERNFLVHLLGTPSKEVNIAI